MEENGAPSGLPSAVRNPRGCLPFRLGVSAPACAGGSPTTWLPAGRAPRKEKLQCLGDF